MRDRDFEAFIAQLKQRTGLDLSQYKQTQMKRRLTSFREKKGYDRFEFLFQAMLKDPSLFDECLDRMTINVSEFFRNPGRWHVLEKEMIPALLKKKKRLKIWSAACSTGEEAYSLVLVLSRHLPLSAIRILATDIDAGAMQNAQKGVYLHKAVEQIPPDLIDRYFTKKENFYVISPSIKSRVTFQKHNLLADPFDDEYDLIVCRNVMIYFTESAKKGLYQRFSKALTQGGVLFVGSTEQIFHPWKFSLESAGPFFYRKI